MAKRLDIDFIKHKLKNEGWKLLSIDRSSQRLIIFIKNPEKFDGFTCKMTWDVWKAGGRPDLNSILDKTKYIKHKLSQEGWELIGDYIGSTSPLLIKNDNLFNGHLCKMTWSNWSKGERPSFISLIDKTQYISFVLKQEGWELLSEYKRNTELLEIRNPDLFNNHICNFTWAAWNGGSRPMFKSLKDKTNYVKDEFSREGWILLEEYKTNSKGLLVKNPNILNGHLCTISWANWSRGARPNFNSLCNKTDYVKQFILDAGYEITDSNWVYKNAFDLFQIKNIKTESKYIINWSIILQGSLPGSVKYKVKIAIRDFFKNRHLSKNPIIKELFDNNYWEELNRHLPNSMSGYHLDHIVPQSFFGDSLQQIRLANDPKNLRPLTAKENIARGNRLKVSELNIYNLWDLYYQAENPMGYKLIEDV